MPKPTERVAPREMKARAIGVSPVLCAAEAMAPTVPD